MTAKNTMLFGAGLALAVGAVAVDYKTSAAPKPVTAAEESYNPCAAPMPKKKGGRNYDDIAAGASNTAPAAPAPMATQTPLANPCSMGQ